MIYVEGDIFWLDTLETSYIFKVGKFSHLEHVYYGAKLKEQDISAVTFKNTAMTGSSVSYDQSDTAYSLDIVPLEWSGIGCGDFRQSPIEAKMPDGTFTCDFVYKSHEIVEGNVKCETLPTSYGEKEDCVTLKITLGETSNNVKLDLFYTVYEKTNVITRRAVLRNENERAVTIRRIMSMMVDMPNKGYKLITFDGGWIKEAHRHDRKLQYGMYVNSSTTGNSSNRHNAGFLIAEEASTEEYGAVYGFNLVYSGNHFGAAELAHNDLVRVMVGINPHCFEWVLEKGERFETPEAVMTFSQNGFNGMSQNFHSFVNEHVVRGEWKGKERPVLINNWEAHFFKFNERKLFRLAKQAKKMGVELFVLDDGWFGERNSDNAGLGDYSVNRKKLPSGISGFAEKVRSLGMGFGLWFEPEMVNENSELFKNNPDFAVKTPNKKPTLGRNQLVLDLCNEKVRDYIVENVGRILDEAKVSYVKWDMNRHISDAYSEHVKSMGEFFHRYILGLYDVLNRIFTSRPHILLESCSSGGNRFDLGMLCFSPQIWASDDTDPVERLKIQGGLSYLYPISTMGAHVSMAPHQQTLRVTPLSTRFNVASFGALGYELDTKHLTYVEKKEIKEQIEFYKRHRKTLQFGTFSRLQTEKDNKVKWQCVERDGSKAVSGFFQTVATASEGFDYLCVKGLLKDKEYTIATKPQSLYIKRFGGLVKHILPIELNPDGFILRTVGKFFCLTDCVEEYTCYGDMLEAGVLLNNQFIGTYYNKNTRLLGDFGSNLYVSEEK